jgi:F420H(2)-dependent quinone reductase
MLPQVLRVHDTVYRKTNGWIGHRTLWIPSLLLHTVGAKTGKQRTTSLTYARDGDSYLVVASKGGAPEALAGITTSRPSPTSRSTSAHGVLLSPPNRWCPTTPTTHGYGRSSIRTTKTATANTRSGRRDASPSSSWPRKARTANNRRHRG